jgi:hypothetical protein
MFSGFPTPFNPLQTYSNAQLVQMINGLRARVAQLETALASTAGQSTRLKVGNSSILLKKDGTIVIEGKDITVKASGNLEMKGSKVRNN